MAVPQFAFVDVPGSGFAHRNLLRRLFGVMGVHEDFGDGPLQPDSLYRVNRERWLEETEERLRGREGWPPVVVGHFWARKYQRVFPDVRLVTFLPDPSARIATLHRFWVDNPTAPGILAAEARRLPLLEAAELPDMRDQVSRFLFPDVYVNELAFVGLVEEWEEDARRMLSEFGWPDVPVPPRDEPPPLPPDVAARLRELNEGDCWLYDDALRLRRGTFVTA